MTKKLHSAFHANIKLSALLGELPWHQAIQDEFYESVIEEAKE